MEQKKSHVCNVGEDIEHCDHAHRGGQSDKKSFGRVPHFGKDCVDIVVAVEGKDGQYRDRWSQQ